MSKSKGNVVTPMSLLEQYGSDAVRYWAASARPGTDTAFDEGQMRIGRKLAIKILNVSRFVLEAGAGSGGPADRRRDLARRLRPAPAARSRSTSRSLAALAVLIDEATAAFEGYDYARALERTEAFFWSFCDDYVELVKSRAYGTLGEDRARRGPPDPAPGAVGAAATAGAVPPVCHRRGLVLVGRRRERLDPPGPLADGGRAAPRPRASLDVWPAASEVLGEIRKAKTEAGRLAAGAGGLGPGDRGRRAWSLQAAEDDLREAGVIGSISWDRPTIRNRAT